LNPLVSKEEERGEGDFEENLPRRTVKKSTKIKSEEEANGDIMMGYQSKIDKSIGGIWNPMRTLGNSAHLSEAVVKNTRINNDCSLLEV
jgi:hypothetical protein